MGCGVKNHLHAFFDGKHARFRTINQYSDNYFIKSRTCALDNVEMTKGHRIKGSWADGAFHEVNASKKISPDPFQA
jgi:hypothetical protein